MDFVCFCSLQDVIEIAANAFNDKLQPPLHVWDIPGFGDTNGTEFDRAQWKRTSSTSMRSVMGFVFGTEKGRPKATQEKESQGRTISEIRPLIWI